MDGLFAFIGRHWLSILLLAGAGLAVFWVFKDKDKLMLKKP